MEDEEDAVRAVEATEQPLIESQLEQTEQGSTECDTVSFAVESTGIEPPVEAQSGEDAVVGVAVVDERGSEVENVEGLELERGEDVNVDSGTQAVVEVGVGEELAGGDAVEVVEREKANENVEGLKPEREDEVFMDVGQPVSAEVVGDELAGQDGATEGTETGDVGENAEDLEEQVSNEEKIVENEEVAAELEGKGEELELVTEEMEVKVEEEVVKGDEEMVGDGGEVSASVEEVKNEEVSKIEEMPIGDEELAREGGDGLATSREEEMPIGDEELARGGDASSTVREEEMPIGNEELAREGGDAPATVREEEMPIGDEEVAEKGVQKAAGDIEAPVIAEEVGKDDAMGVEEVAPVVEEMQMVVEEMQMVDENEKVVNSDELVEKNVESSEPKKEDETQTVEEDKFKVGDELVKENVESSEPRKEDETQKVEEDKVKVADGLVEEKVEKDENVKDEYGQMVDDDDAKVLNADKVVGDVSQEKEGGKVKEEVLGEGRSKGDEEDEELEHSPVAKEVDEEKAGEGEETPIADTEMEVEKSGGSGSGGKRKRGRNAKAVASPVKTPSRKVVGEDVCFICLDGGDLVLCDRRGCPKAYHPSCVDHDDEFFKTKGRWNCGWHLCNKCGKNAYFMCYTCQFSLCKGCSKDAAIFCVRGNKGFCESCMKTIMVIENSEKNEMGQDAFSDKSSWEYLFKDYWLEQKEKLCITSDELGQAKNPWKDSDKQQASIEAHEGNNDYETDSSLEKGVETGKRKPKRRLKSQVKDANSDSEHSSQDTSKKGKRPRRLSKSRSKGANSASTFRGADDSGEGNTEWASKELLEFVMHMKNGDQSVLTQFDVQGLLLEYIKRNKLRDPRRQSQIICDSMLQKLFGKSRVGHFEMLKLLESHFFLKDDRADDNQGSAVETDVSQLDADDDSFLDGGRSRGKKSRKRGEERGLQSNLDDYAAIDIHNINLIFLRRNLMEALMENFETFHDKVVGSFVRIRISGSNQKQDIYRLVQITGTSKATEPYKVGKRTTDIKLEILNLDKTESISLDIISNQDFTEDECKRLRQSIKCGLINRMTVGDILDKAKDLNEVRITDWIEAEIVRLSHLRDRASEKGRKKELCVEKLQLLKTPEERKRRLAELPEVHADPKMDPSCDSEEEDEIDTLSQVSDARPREGGISRRGRDHFSPRKGGSASVDSWSGNARPPSKKWEPSRSSSGKGFAGRREDSVFASPTRDHTWNNGVDKGTPRTNSWEKPRMTSESSARGENSVVRSDKSAAVTESSHISAVGGQTDPTVSDTEKLWHYRDPAGKVQGPFSMTQLHKWSNTGYFPSDLKIWRSAHTEGDSILLTDALAGRFQQLPSIGSNSVGSNLKNLSSIDASKLPINAGSSAGGGRYDSSSLPSPTPGRSPFQSSSQLRAGRERLPSPTPTSPSDPSRTGRPKFSHQAQGGAAVNRGDTIPSAAGAVHQASGQQFFSSPGARPELSSSSGAANGQQTPSQSTVHMGNQHFTPPNTMMNPANAAQNVSNVGQGLSNIIQPGAGQNPSVYAHGWSSGYVANAGSVTASVTPNNQNAVPTQVAYGQWAAAPVTNQAPSYGTGYAAPGNIAANMSAMPSQNAWRPPTNMAWAGQQQQIVNQNMAWAGQQTVAAYGQAGTVAGAMGQHTGSMPGASPVPSGTPTMGWSGAGPNPSAGTTNPGWMAPPVNAGGWVGDQNRNGGSTPYNRQ